MKISPISVRIWVWDLSVFTGIISPFSRFLMFFRLIHSGCSIISTSHAVHKVFSYTHRKVLVFRCTEKNTFFLFRKSQKHLFPNNGKRYCFRCNKKHELSGVTTVNRVFSGLPGHYSNTSLILFLYHLQVLTPSS